MSYGAILSNGANNLGGIGKEGRLVVVVHKQHHSPDLTMISLAMPLKTSSKPVAQPESWPCRIGGHTQQ
jgi:hypothetical protein